MKKNLVSWFNRREKGKKDEPSTLVCDVPAFLAFGLVITEKKGGWPNNKNIVPCAISLC